MTDPKPEPSPEPDRQAQNKGKRKKKKKGKVSAKERDAAAAPEAAAAETLNIQKGEESPEEKKEKLEILVPRRNQANRGVHAKGRRVEKRGSHSPVKARLASSSFSCVRSACWFCTHGVFSLSKT